MGFGVGSSSLRLKTRMYVTQESICPPEQLNMGNDGSCCIAYVYKVDMVKHEVG